MTPIKLSANYLFFLNLESTSEHFLYSHTPSTTLTSQAPPAPVKEDDQGFNLINGLRLGTAPQGLRAPHPLRYGLAYGFSSFGMGNAGNLGGALLPKPPPGPLGSSPPNWLPGSPPLGGGAPEGLFFSRLSEGGSPGRWRPYYYYNAGAPAQNNNDQGDLSGMRKALVCEGWLDIQKLKPFSGCNPQKWRIFLVQCLTMFQSKPHSFTSDQAQVAFTMSYLQGIALDHYTTILHFNSSHPLFINWQAFINKFSSKFSMFDTVAKAERKLMSLRSTNKCFTMFVVQFKKEAYKTGWNYNALRFQLSEALPKHIHNVL
ncbi:hypothetical protein C0995_012793 [Termitomyces sp. Mi166|nr:hypothetical protein C0995_012793 [Termitomyces sp. Mi166\